MKSDRIAFTSHSWWWNPRKKHIYSGSFPAWAFPLLLQRRFVSRPQAVVQTALTTLITIAASGAVSAHVLRGEERSRTPPVGRWVSGVSMGVPLSTRMDFVGENMGKSQSKMDDEWGYPPFQETSIPLSIPLFTAFQSSQLLLGGAGFRNHRQYVV